jgi:hypothetical protein
MTVTPGASLDSAIAGINHGLDNARKVASEINKDDSAKAAKPSASPTASKASTSTSTSTVGGSVDVTV